MESRRLYLQVIFECPLMAQSRRSKITLRLFHGYSLYRYRWDL